MTSTLPAVPVGSSRPTSARGLRWTPPVFGHVARVLPVVGLALLGLLATPMSAHADRVFGEGPLVELLAAAEDEAGTCSNGSGRSLTSAQLVALVAAPTFPETGAPPSQAPSPMTLSRWDNQTALWSFGDVTTFPAAFWHPGVGAWQWDDASGRGWTAAERIRGDLVVGRTVAVMKQRWCQTTATGAAGRAYVWAPWFGCGGGSCEATYLDLLQGGQVVGLDGDPAVGRDGGLEVHACADSTGAPFTCWYVDPSRAQGYLGFTNPAFGPAPVSAPFLTWSDGTREHRTWLREDTGYAIDISASLVAGQNSRTSLAWTATTSVCDLDRTAGACGPAGPDGFTVVAADFGGDRLPVAGDFDGDGADDLFLYGPGGADDDLWLGGDTEFTTREVVVRGTYVPLVGDFDGDGADDIFWYGPGGDPDRLWFGRPGGFDSQKPTVKGTYLPVVGDVDGDGRSDVLWYGRGSNRDSAWYGDVDRGFDFGPMEVNGIYEPVAGDVDGNGVDDVVWYGVGTRPDVVWSGTGTRGVYDRPGLTINGTYRPHVGDVDGDERDDLLLYGPGSGPDRLGFGQPTGFRFERIDIGGDYRIAIGDFDRSGAADVVFHQPGEVGMFWWAD